ncbi:hypothetical protein AUEXF2481DRAFT_570443 [Aureobasidium subglaciale EXF-2481]|uniref:Uncharacterized protein n=1 Tax=Aureobasidium subglaciale (strain EXF-2481) TaxID=1043005 RepID=A0A074XY09_AURSE|nr:uncharacterized protein AUEXF2481DRAFT_570443 [Aureobasidium subglaciale EXF-2481]KEQ90453.1 hypothetical protein AUEXF2481DRAFT_570443 [Aureobasidium subglaciale EXF-2481]
MFIDDIERRMPSLVNEKVHSTCIPALTDVPSPPRSTSSRSTEFTELSEISQELLGQHIEPGLTAYLAIAPNASREQSSYPYSSGSSVSTLTEFTDEGRTHHLPSSPTPGSSSRLTDFIEASKSLRSSSPFGCSTISSLTELTEYDDKPASEQLASPDAISICSTSTFTEFSSLDTTPPSSVFFSTPTSPTTTTKTSVCDLSQRRVKPRTHKNMIRMFDGSEWLPPTLERVQAYISTQGQRRLARSARAVVTQKVGQGSKAAAGYESAILKIDFRVARVSGGQGQSETDCGRSKSRT